MVFICIFIVAHERGMYVYGRVHACHSTHVEIRGKHLELILSSM